MPTLEETLDAAKTLRVSAPDRAALLQQVQETPSLSSSQKETLSAALQQRDDPAPALAGRPRQEMQDWEYFPVYLSSAVWKLLTDQHARASETQDAGEALGKAWPAVPNRGHNRCGLQRFAAGRHGKLGRSQELAVSEHGERDPPLRAGALEEHRLQRADRTPATAPTAGASSHGLGSACCRRLHAGQTRPPAHGGSLDATAEDSPPGQAAFGDVQPCGATCRSRRLPCFHCSATSVRERGCAGARRSLANTAAGGWAESGRADQGPGSPSSAEDACRPAC